MLCQRCGKREATTHVKTVRGVEVEEYSLCPLCAHELGYAGWGFFQEMGAHPFFGLSHLLGGMLEPSFADPVVRCPVCGASFTDISQSGKVGCAKCYEVFYDQLLPSIQRMHGNTRHCGKSPVGHAMQIVPGQNLALAKTPPSGQEEELVKLEKQLQKAIAEQAFEQAAVLRDAIREKKQRKGEGQNEKMV